MQQIAQHCAPEPADAHDAQDKPHDAERSCNVGAEPGGAAERDHKPNDAGQCIAEQDAEAGKRIGQASHQQADGGAQTMIAHRQRIAMPHPCEG